MSSSLAPRRETARESPYFAPRLSALRALGALLFLVLAGRLGYLCVLQGEHFRKLSEDNSQQEERIPAQRGAIYDRYFRTPYERVLAANQTGCRVYLEPEGFTTNTLCQSLDVFAKVSGFSSEAAKARERVRVQLSRSRPKKDRRLDKPTLIEWLSFEQAAPLAERSEEMPGLRFDRAYQRKVLPGGSVEERRAFSHVIGYVGRVADKVSQPKTYAAEMARLQSGGDKKEDVERDWIGKQGLEACYEDQLRGQKGDQMQGYDALPRKIGDPLVLDNAKRGADQALTIDADLQIAASRLMQEVVDQENKPCKGAVIAMDPRNGEILALVSKPEYSANLQDPGFEQDYLNRAISTSYPPGSTFKLVTASAALAGNFITPSTTFVCNKAWPFYDAKFFCLHEHGPGIDLYQAISKSCNVYFFETARLLRWGALADCAAQYGFGQSAGIDLKPSDIAGVLKTPRSPKEKDRVNGAVIQMGIGQAENINVTPLQVVSAYAALANPNGLLLRPHLLKETLYHDEKGDVVEDPGYRGKTPASDPAIRAILIDAFRQTVEQPYGTASRVGFDPAWKVAGKTGTAEWTSEQAKAHSWFVCFAPWDNPEIAVVALCEKSGHGSEAAAHVVRGVLEVYFQKCRPKMREMESAGAEVLHVEPEK